MVQKNISSNLGIIAGGGDLPGEIANIHYNNGGKVYIAALEGEGNIDPIKQFPHKIFKIGSVSKIIDYFQAHAVRNIIFVGTIKRGDFSSIKVDIDGAKLIAKITTQKLLGDDNILRVIADFFEKKGFKVISPQDILDSDVGSNKLLTDKKPSKQDLMDIEIGVNALKALSPFDVGQGVIINNRRVIGIEGVEGTDNLISRCSSYKPITYGGVLVKTMKTSQDHRLDIPTIGPKTIDALAQFKYNGVAIEDGGVILVDNAKTIGLANKHKIFIIKV